MSVKIEGLKELTRNLEKRSAKVIKAIDDDLTEGAELIEGRAKLLAPVDRGLLRANIVADTGIPLNKQVTDSSFYAPYMEFGTGRKYNGKRPEIARQYKGAANRGSFEDMVKNIGDWLKRKGYYPSSLRGQKAKQGYARKVAGNILRNGVEAANDGTGYFFRAYDEILPSILDNVRKSLKEL